MKTFLVSILLVGLTQFGQAQDSRNNRRGNAPNQGQPPINFMGEIYDQESQKPIEYATVSIFTLADSTLFTGGISSSEGKFEFSVKPGNYYAKIEFISYEDKIIEGIKIQGGQPINLGKIMMTVSAQQLETVTVQAEKTQMELSLDKKVYNIGKDLSNIGGSATDILDNLPSVQVDVEGNVSLRGSENIKILIDGKPSGLVGLSSNDALRQLNSNLVDKIEIITNPSARYDAEGEGGIINIILKKEKSKGINGSFQVNTGWPHNHGFAVNLNVRKKWVNFFTNVGLGYRKNPGGGDSYQEFGIPTNRITDRSRDFQRGGINYSTRFGADFYLNETNTLTLSFLYRFSDENNTSDINYLDHYVTENVDSLTYRRGDEMEDDENLEYAINYTKTFKTKGRKFSTDFQYQDNNEIEATDLVESSGAFSEQLIPYLYQRSINDEGEKRIMIQSSYNHPFAEKGMIEGGFRYTDRTVRNEYNVEEQNSSGQYELDTDFSNDFEYIETVTAIYAMVSNKWSKLSLQGGLRYEKTNLITTLKTTNVRNVQDYSNFFPSAFMTYDFTKEHAVQASYSRRIRRPRGRFLNPFSSISDSRNFFTGNPLLQPVFTDSYELGYLFNGEKSSFYGGLYFRQSEGVYQRLRNTIDGITFTQPFNISERKDTGVEFNIAYEFASWYRANTNLNFYNSRTLAGSYVFENTVNDFDAVETTTFSGRLNNNFKLTKLIDAQINVSYRAPQNTVQGKRFSMASVDLGFSRDILKGNGTLALNVRDLFNTRKYRGETFNEGFYENSEFQRRRRSTQLSFTYRLNQKKNSKKSNRNNENGDGDGGDEF